jgi:hypothetical protein
MSLPPAIRALSDQLRQALTPGTRLFIVIVEHPDGCSYMSGEPEITSQTATTPCSGSPASESASIAMSRREGESPTSFLQRVRRENGLVSMKPKEWASLLGTSVAALERAMAAGDLESTRKEDGRDHGARLVRCDHLLAHFALLDAVERGVVAAPTWSATTGDGKAA